MKRQDIFLIGCLLSALSFLYFESSSTGFQSFNTLSGPSTLHIVPLPPLKKEARVSALSKNKIVEKEVATVE